MMNRETAWERLCEWTEGESLRKHARAVEVVMRSAAEHYGGPDADADQWALAGLLHDADYERWPEEHPQHVVAWLKEMEQPELAHAISAHYTKWGVPHQSKLDCALVACDELTGFVMACSLIRPEGVRTLGVKSVRKRLKNLRFAAGVERAEVQAGVDLLGVELADHIQFVIAALQPHAEELGIAGKPQS